MVQALLPYPEIDPVLIHLGPIAIRWYALSYITGFLLGWWLLLRILRQASLWTAPLFKGKPPATADDIGDLFVWVVLGAIAGGRLGYDLFYGTIFCGIWTGRDCGIGLDRLPMAYLHHPLRLIAEWNGWVPVLRGLSFHGGLIGVVLVLLLFCRNRKLNLFQVGDVIATVTPVIIFLVRIANFINAELWGKVTNSPLGMVFCNPTILENYGFCPAGMQPRHPSQLYEAALEGLVLFAVMQVSLRVFRLHERPGVLTAIFFAGYGAARFFVEFFRDSESMIAGSSWFSMGMALSLPMLAAAAFFLWAAYKRPAWTSA